MQSGSLKIQLSDIHDALLAAVYYQRNETSSLSEMGDGNTEIEEKRQEYFTLVADAQQKLQLQRQERRKLETQLAMENALRRELSRQLDQLERELAQLHMCSGRNRAEIDCERAAVEQLELEYATLTSEEEDLQRDCEVLTLQLENQRAQLKELRGQQLYLDFVSSAPLKRHLEEKKWRGQHAAVLTQVQSAEAENRVIEEELKQLEDQGAGLEAQFGRDVQAKQQAETALSEARVRQQHIQEGFEQMRSCYTPRPDWDRIVDETPELSVQKYQWELAGSASDHQLGASIDDQTSQGEKTTKRCRSGVGGGCKDAGEEDAEGWRLPPSNGRTKLLVKEMMVWIERLQKHCGVNLHLSRIWHDIEEARVELNILHHQLDRAMRKSSTSAIPISEASGITAAAVAALNSPSKAKQDYILALGAHEGVPKFLRHRGKLKRQVLKKGEVDKVVRKVWVEKRKRERRNPLAKIPLEQVLYEKLHRKYGFQPLIAEWGYNLLLALQIFSWDTEIEMFLLCLTGAVSDRVYVDQEQMIESCHHLLLRLCELYRVESFVSERRVLLKDALVAMRKFFPLKTSGQLQAIEQAIIRDMHKMKRGGNDSILYIEDILPLDARYPVGFFVKTVRTQHFKEIQDYYATLLRYRTPCLCLALSPVLNAKPVVSYCLDGCSELQQRDANQMGTLPLSAIKEVIMAVDPLTETAAVYTLLMKAGGVKSRAQLDMLEIVNYKAALKQMNTTCLMKFALNFDPNAEINWRPRQTVDPIGGGKSSSGSDKRPANA
ncbi:hypothetical protein BBJ28_00022690 [Nothophytophthora sp. Chile5]|nr:hypothetical protein BBJ28_00022690 [Nothophytophthora sp. Chile5]